MKKVLVGLVLFVFVGVFAGCSYYEPPIMVIFDSNSILRVEKYFTEDDTIWITPEFSFSNSGDSIIFWLINTTRIRFPQITTKPDEYNITILNEYETENLLNQNAVNFTSFLLRGQPQYVSSEFNSVSSDIMRIYHLEARWGSNVYEYYFIIYDHRTIRILANPAPRFIIQNNTNGVTLVMELLHETASARYYLPDHSSHFYSVVFPGEENVFSIRFALTQGFINICELIQGGMPIFRSAWQ